MCSVHSDGAETQRPSGGRHLPAPAASPSPCPLRRFRSVPLFCFCIWFCDSFEDTNMPQNSHRSQSRLSCRPLAVIANICLTRCPSAVVNTLSSFKSQVNMICPLSFQILPSSHMSGQISDLHTHTHPTEDPRARRPRGEQIPFLQPPAPFPDCDVLDYRPS